MVAAGVAGAAVGAVAANALADDKSTSAEHQVTQPGNEQAVQAQEEKKVVFLAGFGYYLQPL
jgi:hypothetical protein